MSDRATFLRVGLLLAAGVALAVGLVLFLAGQRITNGETYETYFKESVQGLQEGAPVKYRGVTVGQVNSIALVTATYHLSDIDLSRNDFRLVVVRFVVDRARIGMTPGAKLAIDIGLRVKLASQGITGLSYLEIDFVNPKAFPLDPNPATLPWTPTYTVLPSIPSTIAQVQDAAQKLLAKLDSLDVEGLTASLSRVLDDAHAQLTNGALEQTLANANTLLTTLNAAVAGADLPALSADLKATSGAVRALAQGRETKDLLASTARAADRLRVAADGLPPLIAAMQALVQRIGNTTADVQAELAPVLRDARAATANLRATSEDLRRYPSGVLLGGPPRRDDGR